MQGWGRHKRKRERRKVLVGFSFPPGHREADGHGKGDWGIGPWSKGYITGTFKRMKSKRTVPEGSCRKEIWEIA